MLNEYRGYNLDWRSWNSWDWPERMLTPNDLRWVSEVAVSHGLYRFGHVEKGAIAGLERLRAMGHEVYFITHRPVAAVQDTIDFLSYARLHPAGVHILSEEQPKKNIECDVYVDDKPQTIADIVVNTGKVGILYDQPWNQGVIAGDGNPRFHRVRGWREVVEVIRGLER